MYGIYSITHNSFFDTYCPLSFLIWASDIPIFLSCATDKSSSDDAPAFFAIRLPTSGTLFNPPLSNVLPNLPADFAFDKTFLPADFALSFIFLATFFAFSFLDSLGFGCSLLPCFTS